MARPIGAVTDPSKGRPPGPPERTGHRSARDALVKDAPLRGLALEAQGAALARYEMDGVYSLALENASRVQAVCDCHWAALLAEEQKDEPNQKTLMELSRRLVTYLQRATSAWVEVEEMRRGNVTDVLDAAMMAAGGHE
jgi:hypothetical protein